MYLRGLFRTKEWSIFSKLVLKDKNWKIAINYARKKLNIIADVYGEKSFTALKLKVDAFKVHSEDF